MINQEYLNLKILSPSRKRLKSGDVFILKPKERGYFFGLIVNSNASCDRDKPSGLIHIHIFDLESKIENIPDNLFECKLLIPPIVTNRLGWSKGYFKVISNIDINNYSGLNKSSFYYYPKLVFDDKGNELFRPIDYKYLGISAISSYNGIDARISYILGLQLENENGKEFKNLFEYIEDAKKYFNGKVSE